jgi:hypothetical protein
MEVGQYANAAVIFDRLAQEALDHGFERQAPFMFLQAGRAGLLAGQTQEATARLHDGLEWLAQQKRWLVLRKAGQRLLEDLNRLDQHSLAGEISAWLDTLLQDHDPLDADPISPAPPHRRLPLQCPHCGAPVRPGEAELLEESAAECAYCGGMMPYAPA